jgi:hypothetical protein
MVIGIETRYALEDHRIKLRWRQDFPQLFKRTLEPTLPPVRLNKVSFPAVNRPGHEVDHPPNLTLR